ncbi:MucBP domain-containing protein, partial [Vagococcus sp. PNs007]
GTTEVTYIYKKIEAEPEEKFGSLVVRHITEDGKELAPIVGTTEKVGTAYSTENQSFDGYEFVKVSDDSGKPAGEYVEGTTNVTYIYKKIEVEPEEKFGSLVVRYITENGKELAPITGTTEKVGTRYETKEEKFDGYEFVKLSDDSGKPTGEYVEGTTEVTYIYKAIEVEPEEKFGSLVVRHITEDGKELAPIVGKTEKVGTAYSTENQSFDGYEFVKVSDDSGKSAGEYVEGTTEVTYIYKAIEAEPEEKFGSLVVRHITEDGKELAPIVGTTEKVGTAYSTENQSFDGYEFVKLSDDSGKPTGEYVEGTIEVTYIYKKIEAEPEEKFGSLVVRYITEDGKELAPIVGTTQKVGTAYETKEEKFDGYKFVKLSDNSGKPSGEYVEGTTNVTYIYKKIEVEPEEKFGSLVVRHITEDGKELAPIVGTTEKVGTTYETKEEKFDGYEFVKLSDASGKAAGEYAEGTTNVTYIYKALEVESEEKFGSLVVRYITEDGKELAPIVGTTEKVGTAYETKEEKFDGYKFVKLSEDSAKVSGEYVEGITKVTYIYKAINDVSKEEPKEKYGNLIVRHITEDGKELGFIKIENKKIGTPYETAKKTFKDYTFLKLDESSSKIKGEYKEGTTEVIYIYKKIAEKVPSNKIGSLVITHMTKDGKLLKESSSQKNIEGTPYITNFEKIKGYKFVGLSEKSAPRTGNYSSGITEVIFVYEPIKNIRLPHDTLEKVNKNNTNLKGLTNVTTPLYKKNSSYDNLDKKHAKDSSIKRLPQTSEVRTKNHVFVGIALLMSVVSLVIFRRNK